MAQAGGSVCGLWSQELGTGLRLLIPRTRTRGEDAFTLHNLPPVVTVPTEENQSDANQS